MITDTELIQRSMDRDDRAFSELFDRHATAVYRYAFRLTRDSADAQRLVQETFLTAWRRLADIALVGESLLPWLIAACRNHAFALRRSTPASTSLPLEWINAELANPLANEQFARGAEVEWAYAAIGRLGETDRRIVELCLYEGRSYAEAAAILGLTPSAFTAVLERAKGKARTVLSRFRESEAML